MARLLWDRPRAGAGGFGRHSEGLSARAAWTTRCEGWATSRSGADGRACVCRASSRRLRWHRPAQHREPADPADLPKLPAAIADHRPLEQSQREYARDLLARRPRRQDVLVRAGQTAGEELRVRRRGGIRGRRRRRRGRGSRAHARPAEPTRRQGLHRQHHQGCGRLEAGDGKPSYPGPDGRADAGRRRAMGQDGLGRVQPGDGSRRRGRGQYAAAPRAQAGGEEGVKAKAKK